MESWSYDNEKREIAQEIEEGTRVALHRHLENRSSFKIIHIEELAKEAQRFAQIKDS